MSPFALSPVLPRKKEERPYPHDGCFWTLRQVYLPTPLVDAAGPWRRVGEEKIHSQRINERSRDLPVSGLECLVRHWRCLHVEASNERALGGSRCLAR